MSKTLNPTAGKSIIRKQGVALWAGANNVVTLQLQRQNLYRGLGIRYQATPTLTAGNNTVANTAKGDEWGGLSRIRVVVNGTDALLDMTGDDLYMLNKTAFGIQPRITPTLGDGATANPALDSFLHIPFWALRCLKPMDTAYESWRAGSLQIELTFANYTAINTAATAWTANPQVEVYSSEITPAFDGNNNLKFVPPWVPRIVRQYVDFATSQTGGKFYLDSAPYHRGILLNVQASGGGDDLTTALTNVKLFAGTTQHRDLAASVALRYGELLQSLPANIEIDSTNIARQTRGRVSQSSDPRAWYYISLPEDGYMSEAIGGLNAQDVYLEFQTSAACRIVAICQQVLPNPALG